MATLLEHVTGKKSANITKAKSTAESLEAIERKYGVDTTDRTWLSDYRVVIVTFVVSDPNKLLSSEQKLATKTILY